MVNWLATLVSCCGGGADGCARMGATRPASHPPGYLALGYCCIDIDLDVALIAIKLTIKDSPRKIEGLGALRVHLIC